MVYMKFHYMRVRFSADNRDTGPPLQGHRMRSPPFEDQQIINFEQKYKKLPNVPNILKTNLIFL